MNTNCGKILLVVVVMVLACTPAVAPGEIKLTGPQQIRLAPQGSQHIDLAPGSRRGRMHYAGSSEVDSDTIRESASRIGASFSTTIDRSVPRQQSRTRRNPIPEMSIYLDIYDGSLYFGAPDKDRPTADSYLVDDVVYTDDLNMISEAFSSAIREIANAHPGALFGIKVGILSVMERDHMTLPPLVNTMFDTIKSVSYSTKRKSVFIRVVNSSTKQSRFAVFLPVRNGLPGKTLETILGVERDGSVRMRFEGPNIGFTFLPM
eukprot:Lankesteria_metandrocarpae@DN4989_c4_g1_i1.p1